MTVESGPRQSRRRLITIAACFMAQNLTMGLGFGTFGPLLAANEVHFGITRAYAATGMSIIMLVLGVLSPIIGSMMARVPVRAAMVVGAILSAIGYFGLAIVTTYGLALPLYGLIGAGVCLTGLIGPVTLTTRWISHNRGKILAIVNLPFILFVSPYLVSIYLSDAGRTSVLVAISLCFIALVPLLLLISERPGETAPVAGQAGTEEAILTMPVNLLMRWDFWCLSIAGGLLSAMGGVYTVHVVPFGVSMAMTPTDAALLLSIFAGAGLLGSPLFGWLTDRLTPPRAMILSAFVQAAMWWSLISAPVYSFLGIAAIMGLCTVPITTIYGAALGYLYGPQLISKAFGYGYAIKLPFLFVAAPLAGWAFEMSGNYRLAFMLSGIMLCVAIALLTMIALRARSAADMFRTVSA